MAALIKCCGRPFGGVGSGVIGPCVFQDSNEIQQTPSGTHFSPGLTWVPDAVWAIGHKLKQINKDVAAAVSAVFLLLARSLQEVWRWTGSLAPERKFGAAGEVWRWSISDLGNL